MPGAKDINPSICPEKAHSGKDQGRARQAGRIPAPPRTVGPGEGHFTSVHLALLSGLMQKELGKVTLTIPASSDSNKTKFRGEIEKVVQAVCCERVNADRRWEALQYFLVRPRLSLLPGGQLRTTTRLELLHTDLTEELMPCPPQLHTYCATLYHLLSSLRLVF